MEQEEFQIKEILSTDLCSRAKGCACICYAMAPHRILQQERHFRVLGPPFDALPYDVRRGGSGLAFRPRHLKGEGG